MRLDGKVMGQREKKMYGRRGERESMCGMKCGAHESVSEHERKGSGE